jgi:ribosomal-protein-alanine N-acetyltransferase
MLALLELAVQVGAAVATLEVRLSNVAARTLYQRFGFHPVGVRPRYYSDDGEDALIMTTERLDSPAMRRRLAAMARVQRQRTALVDAGEPLGAGDDEP